MSCDFGVWYPHERLGSRRAGELYVRLCEGDASGVRPHPAVNAFYAELTARHPEIDDIPEDRIDDTDFCPWSCAIDRSPGHVVLSCAWSRADHVRSLVLELARKHGLAVYDPQAGAITYPDGAAPETGRKRPWWRIW